MTSDDELFDEIGKRLATRPGWHLEPSPTPGGPPSWCLVHEGEIALAVGVEDGAVAIFSPSLDRDVARGSVDGLVAWLDEHEAGFRAP